jgi:cyclopropane fatty-acyl-phospholipid synthase-like methyltransferase
MHILISLLVFGIPIYIIWLFGYSLIKGAPYAPVSQERIKVMVKLLNLKKGQKMADLGSGDGRIMIAFARLGIEAHGYEINPILVLIANWYIRKYRLQNKAFIHWTDFWKSDLSRYDGITLFGITHMMPSLEKKLKSNLKPKAKVVSNHFQFPNWKASQTLSDVRLYLNKSLT